ncbi:hypothetical protein MVLG_01522 [Microbotryum lychnidis-dioicae p1A1 Lamole]|uniref:Vacuolar protein sorting 55 n=4 Tax=Microbotryum TaxID=34416 RepID=U5H2D3_USTV1|nr:hypothetical protein MVLG_01522 [Microbotryum lychnidis-dioicae p1A1 Lamole]SCV68832.1 BQ2448_953 [Microbotryum intermedium]SCZ90949.1 BZ3500_MvSof-1268-A1-R1_Chr1-3g02412 [Microbotryum saponariae]SCZ96199.1 BZ3501_MvSof-1269-A2-R1_Chr1-3g02015 [Microbotryum saponariae]SGY30148.1 BQ5605_C002g01122 [Microbotryum silenes-dioicae]|eukprot:KDE08256.1 hypothetical protein MVLG_01522 [Microbotryum lychnidis-dioicae p1A1 Lamole]
MTAGLKTIIFLSFVLAVSFLLVILSCALWANWLPLITALIFAFAPLPNALFSRFQSEDSFSAEYSSGPVDFGRFLTACFLVSGVAFPFALAHAGVIHEMAGWMSATGGAVGYATIITYSHFFAIQIAEY